MKLIAPSSGMDGGVEAQDARCDKSAPAPCQTVDFLHAACGRAAVGFKQNHSSLQKEIFCIY
jgi:hypothetical protein